MSKGSLEALPAEILDTILEYLPIRTLLSFSRTNKSHHASAIHALRNLELAVLPKRIHTVLAFLENIDEENCGEEDQSDIGLDAPDIKQRSSRTSSRISRRNRELHQVGLTTSSNSRLAAFRHCTPESTVPKSDTPTPSLLQIRAEQVHTQDIIASNVLSSQSLHNLRSLSLHLYTLTPIISTVLATSFPILQYLSLNFSHPYINDPILPSRHWRETPSAKDSSPAWNALAGLGVHHESNLVLRSLRKLQVKRAAITSAQLRSWIVMNPVLEGLDLVKARGVDVEFCDWFAGYIDAEVRPVNTITFEDCASLKMKTRADFDWIDNIVKSKTFLSDESDCEGRSGLRLSLKGCTGVDEKMFLDLACANHLSSRGSEPGIDENSWISRCKTARLISPSGKIISSLGVRSPKAFTHTGTMIEPETVERVSCYGYRNGNPEAEDPNRTRKARHFCEGIDMIGDVIEVDTEAY